MSRRRSETELLGAIRARLARPAPGLEVGIGDDAAIVRFDAPRQAISCDLLVAGVDLPANADPAFLARKAFAANVSDLFAAGARPTCAFAAVGLPDDAGDDVVDRFLDALDAASRRWGCPVAGGDLSGAPAWTVSLTVLGAPLAEPWLRRGASPGDELWWVGAPAGHAAAGLRLLLAGAEGRPDGAVRFPAGWDLSDEDERSAAGAIFAQLDPSPANVVAALVDAGGVAAAIDVSDGLLLDASRLADASGVALDLDLDAVPVARLADRVEALLARDPLGDALSGGEDFALLVAVPPGRADRWPAAVRGMSHRVGRFAAGRGVETLRGGTRVDLSGFPAGWDHFAARGAR